MQCFCRLSLYMIPVFGYYANKIVYAKKTIGKLTKLSEIKKNLSQKLPTSRQAFLEQIKKHQTTNMLKKIHQMYAKENSMKGARGKTLR